MVFDLIWEPDFFGPQKIWSMRRLGPEKLGPQENFPCMKIIMRHCNAGTQKVLGPNEIWDHFR